MLKFGRMRRPFVLFSLILSIAIHIGVGAFLFKEPLQLVKLKSLALLKGAMIKAEVKPPVATEIEVALEESINSMLTYAEALRKEQELPQSQNALEQNEKTPPEMTQKTSVTETSQEDLSSSPFVEIAGQVHDPFEKKKSLTVSDIKKEQINAVQTTFPEKSTPLLEELEKEEQLLLESPALSLKSPFEVASIEQKLYEEDLEFYIEETSFEQESASVEELESGSFDFFSAIQKLSASSIEKERSHEQVKMYKECLFAPEVSSAEAFALPNPLELLSKQWIERRLTEARLEKIEYYGLEAVTKQLIWEENIDVEVKLSKDSSGEKYIFSLEIQPELVSQYEAMPQNFYFLIESPSAIDKHKFSRYKRAVQRSLAALSEGDHFNICILDKKLSKFAEEAVPVNEKTVKKAEEFLENFEGKGGRGELLGAIDKFMPLECDPQQVYSLIFLSDGKGLLTKSKQKNFFSHFSAYFERKFNIYTVASGRGNDLTALDVMSYATGGKTLYSDTNAALPRKLVKLVKELHRPLIKDLSVEISVKDPHIKASLYPQEGGRLPPLFIGQPYVVMGSITAPCQITLLIEGRNQNRQINLQKSISLEGEEIETGGRILEKEWAISLSKTCYEHFLMNGKNSHLSEAKQLVAPYRGLISLEQ